MTKVPLAPMNTVTEEDSKVKDQKHSVPNDTNYFDMDIWRPRKHRSWQM